jgi:hypothetical protein
MRKAVLWRQGRAIGAVAAATRRELGERTARRALERPRRRTRPAQEAYDALRDLLEAGR